MAGRLAGKVAIATGAGSSGPGMGNGKATAIVFARERTKVLCVDQVIGRDEEAVAAISGEGGVAAPYPADVSVRADCAGMVRAAVDRLRQTGHPAQ
jgi:NAD(P)-dependent dehydrogenase (short-subunit alcohol dehydrogenase family)